MDLDEPILQAAAAGDLESVCAVLENKSTNPNVTDEVSNIIAVFMLSETREPLFV